MAARWPTIEEFWEAFLQADIPGILPDAFYFEAFSFGSTPEHADHLAALVLRGVKTSTSALVWEFEARGLRPVRSGDLSIVMDAAGRPVCVIETTEARIIPFSAVDASFARDYGEGDRTLEWWREHLYDYYIQLCARENWPASQEMPLVCERFRVVFRAG